MVGIITLIIPKETFVAANKPIQLLADFLEFISQLQKRFIELCLLKKQHWNYWMSGLLRIKDYLLFTSQCTLNNGQIVNIHQFLSIDLVEMFVDIMQVCIMQPSPPPLGGIMHVLFSLYCAIGSRGSSRGDRRSSQRDIWWQTRGRSCTPPWQSRALTTSDDIWQYLMTDHCGHLTIGNRLYRDSDFLPSKFHYGGLPNHPTFVFVI